MLGMIAMIQVSLVECWWGGWGANAGQDSLDGIDDQLSLGFEIGLRIICYLSSAEYNKNITFSSAQTSTDPSALAES
jgi:hypothetical protein